MNNHVKYKDLLWIAFVALLLFFSFRVLKIVYIHIQQSNDAEIELSSYIDGRASQKAQDIVDSIYGCE